MQLKSRYVFIFFVIIFWASVTPGYGQYNFSFECVGDTIQYGLDLIQFYFRLENTGALADSYAFDCRVIDSVPGWFEIYCAGGQCAEPGIILYDFLNPGAIDSGIDISVYTTAGNATEIINLFVQSMGDTNLKDSINVYAVRAEATREKNIHPSPAARLKITPNPFTETPNISFNPPVSKDISINIYNINGQLIKHFRDPQDNKVNWNCRDEKGKKIPAGVYILELQVEGYRVLKKMLFIR